MTTNDLAILQSKFGPCCPGNVNNDGLVDVNDLLAVIAAWGPYTACPPFIPADLDLNCMVDVNDLLIVIASWGPCCP
ncbi:MAG: hypothetical protein L0Y44_15850 [Phycisphaerales bacterium]|nr:hypothetical protein [Phycisphaerales bacterium]MCI0632117.1 hypothetical protein [Phycisphaerales bacterium]MCI0676664.1 hypothetical protein [Phycisphaerales bacterium]